MRANAACASTGAEVRDSKNFRRTCTIRTESQICGPRSSSRTPPRPGPTAPAAPGPATGGRRIGDADLREVTPMRSLLRHPRPPERAVLSTFVPRHDGPRRLEQAIRLLLGPPPAAA